MCRFSHAVLKWLRGNWASALLGAILGFGVSQIEQHYSAKALHDKVLTARINAVLSEIKVNEILGTNTTLFTYEADSLNLKRHYSLDALVALSNDLPELLPDDTLFSLHTAALLAGIQTLNQLIHMRNLTVHFPAGAARTRDSLDNLIKYGQRKDSLEYEAYIDSLESRLPD